MFYTYVRCRMCDSSYSENEVPNAIPTNNNTLKGKTLYSFKCIVCGMNTVSYKFRSV